MLRTTRRWRLPALLTLGALTAGTVVLGASSAQATPDFTIERSFAGATRAATAALIAKDTFPSGSDNAIIVRETDFADALAGNYLAGLVNAPLLLTSTNTLSPETAQALVDLDVESATILGGTTAVSQAVQDTIVGSGVHVTRIGGTDRFDTAVRVVLAGQQLPGAIGTDPQGHKVAIVSSGRNFPDALASGPMVFSQHFPQLLTEVNTLPAGTRDFIDQANIDRVILTGGTNAVSTAVENALKAIPGVTVDRIAGSTRYDTAIKLAQFEGQNFGYTAEHINIATGENFPDALAGGPHGGTEKAAIILTPNTTAGPDAQLVCSALDAIKGSLKSAHVFGGTVAVSDAVVDALEVCGGQTAGPAPGTGQIVAVDTAANTYTFVQTSDNAVITVNYDDDDDFTVGGATSTLANFESNLTVGDTITFTDDTTPTDNDVHALTNTTVTSGLVGEVDITANTFSIINPVTGTRVGGPFTYNEASDVFGSTPAVFEGNINEGDTVTVSEDPNTHVKTITLTNATLTGVVTDLGFFPTAVAFIVDHHFGDQFDTSVPGDVVFVASLAPVTGTETYSIGGVAGKTFADFAGAISVGDTVAVSRAGNVENFALTNAAPPVQQGQAIDDLDTAADTFSFVTAAGDVVAVDYTAVTQFTVNNANGTAADFEAQYTPGDAVSFQAADAATSTVAKVTLTNQPLQGQIANIDLGADEYDVLAVDKSTVLATVDYTAGTNRYFINGNDDAHEVTLAAWETKLGQLDFVPAPAELDDNVLFQPTALANRHVLTTNDT